MPSSAPYGLRQAYDGRQTVQIGFDPSSEDGSAVPFGSYKIEFIVSSGCGDTFVAAIGNGLTIDPDAGSIDILIPARRLRCGPHGIQLVWTEIATGIVDVHVDGTIQIDGDY